MTAGLSLSVRPEGSSLDDPGRAPLLSVEDFRRNGRHIDAPFRIRLLRGDDAAEVHCVELYRVLPGKRVVVRAELDGRAVVLKLFLGNGAVRYRQREARGIAAIARCGVEVPALLDGGRLETGAGEWLAFEFVAGARALSERDLADGSSCAAVLRALAQLHGGGVVQHDLHLGNFLLTDDKTLYTIDGDAVRTAGGASLDRRRSLHNLALFFAQFPPREDHRVAKAYHTYAAARGWPVQRMDPEHVIARVASARETRLQRYLKKTVRECTEFHAEATASRFLVADRSALANGLDEVLRGLERAVDTATTLKSGRTATVVEVNGTHATYVVKRYNIKSLRHALSRLLRPSRAYHAWRNAHCLRFLGISDARPKALLERRLLRGLRRDAYLVMGKVEGSDLMRHVAMEGGCSDAVVAAVVKLFADLKDLRFVHGDTKASNFIVTKEGVVLIDLDSMRRVRRAGHFATRFAADLDRFLENFSALPAVRERFRAALAPLRRELTTRL